MSKCSSSLLQTVVPSFYLTQRLTRSLQGVFVKHAPRSVPQGLKERERVIHDQTGTTSTLTWQTRNKNEGQTDGLDARVKCFTGKLECAFLHTIQAM